MQAPLRKVTINGGFPCNSWYDIKQLTSEKGSNVKEEDIISIKEVNESLELIED